MVGHGILRECLLDHNVAPPRRPSARNTWKSVAAGSLASWRGPALGGRGRRMNSVALATVLWRHGPEMYRRTQSLGIPWPMLEEKDLGDLFAFLNATPEERQK